MTKTFPKLYGKSSTGKWKEWSIWVVEDLSSSTIHISHGYEDGKKQEITRTVYEGKNIGKTNETTPYQQAISEAQSEWNGKIDKKYVEDKSNLSEVILPMLALKYEERKHNIKYPAFAQPKLDGVRCLASKNDSEIQYLSRKGKPYGTLGHLDQQIKDFLGNDSYTLDGEIYIHKTEFQEIIRRVKKARPESRFLQYWIYDVIMPGKTFEERHAWLKERFEKSPQKRLIFVDTFEVKNEEELLVYHDEFVINSFEGVMVRNKTGMYLPDYRSPDLQKYKVFKDEEFEITGFYEGEGLHEGCIGFFCKTDTGKEFKVYPEGTMEHRRSLKEKKSELLGSMLTVRFQKKSEDGTPVFGIGVTVRDYE